MCVWQYNTSQSSPTKLTKDTRILHRGVENDVQNVDDDNDDVDDQTVGKPEKRRLAARWEPGWPSHQEAPGHQNDDEDDDDGNDDADNYNNDYDDYDDDDEDYNVVPVTMLGW